MNKRLREPWEQEVMDKLTEQVQNLPSPEEATMSDLGKALAWLAIHETTEKRNE